MTDSDFVLASQAARIANVSAGTIRVWTTSGRLPCQLTVGGVRLIRVSDLQHVIESRRGRRERG